MPQHVIPDRSRGDILRHHRRHRATLFGESFAERSAERFAQFLGSVRFIVISTAVIVMWLAVNAGAQSVRWDPFPFILLNLAFSAFAFYTGALVIIAQKAQAKKDRAREFADAAHREDLHAELVTLLEQSHALLASNTRLTEEVNKVVRGVRTLSEQVHAHVCGGNKQP